MCSNSSRCRTPFYQHPGWSLAKSTSETWHHRLLPVLTCQRPWKHEISCVFHGHRGQQLMKLARQWNPLALLDCLHLSDTALAQWTVYGTRQRTAASLRMPKALLRATNSTTRIQSYCRVCVVAVRQMIELSSTHWLRSRLWLTASEVLDGKLPDTSGAIVVDEPPNSSTQRSVGDSVGRAWLSSPQS